MASTVLPNGIIIPEKYSRDWYADLYHNWQELDNLLGGGGANDGTLTIQKNGTTVETFSANQATDATANIEVPTKTSDLTNDSGFITEDNTKIPLSGSNAISGSLIPSTDGTVDLGGSNYQWNNAYIKSLTINGVACGDILTHNVSEFVDVTTAQTIAGVKTFSDGLFVSKSIMGALATLEDKSINSTNEDANGMPLTGHTNSIKIKGSQVNVIPCMLTGQVFTSGDTSAELRVYKYKDTSRMAALNINYVYNNDTARAQFVNCDISTSVNGVYNIGSSSRKWKSFNGINPGALSLPSTSYTTLDVTNFVLDGDTNNRIVMPYDGWLNIRMTSCEKYSVRNTLNGITYQVENASGLVHLTIPVPSGTNMAIYAKCSSIDLRAFTCQGNV